MTASQEKKLHLQGLRTVAIVAVVLFHFFPKRFPNGYLGVDQFFLLSGYLMTMMLERNQTLSFSSVADFFYRRVKRIVPLYYLTTLFIIGISFSLIPAALRTNFESAIKAILFSTNIVRPTGLEGYAERLGLGVDMLTHTWSLSVEMQYYFIVPVIFSIVRLVERKHRNKLIFIISLLSFYFHATADSFLSFYSVAARIWQFLAGMMIFYCSENSYEVVSGSSQDGTKLLVEEGSNDEIYLQNCFKIGNEENISITVSLSVVLSLMLFSLEVPPVLARIVTILLTSLIVHEGESSSLLKNRVVVFLGEISYAWYLVHWPIVALLKMNKMTTDKEMFLGFLISLFASIIVHYACERQYLAWSKSTTVKALVFLLALNGVALWKLGELNPSETVEISKTTSSSASLPNATHESRFIYKSDSMNKLLLGYENKTAEERAKMNDQFDANDQVQIADYPCVELPVDPGFPRLCRIKDPKSNSTQKGNRTLLLIGNSWAGNVAKLIHDECQKTFDQILVTWASSCEVLTQTSYGWCSFDFGTETIKKYNPDVLFIIDRHLDAMAIVNGTNPFNDNKFSVMIKRMEEIEKHVKEEIYILDALPRPFNTITETMNKFLRKGTSFKDEDLIEHAVNFKIAKERVRRIEQGCAKCRVYDYEPYFYIDGKIRLYDPEYYVSFFSRGDPKYFYESDRMNELMYGYENSSKEERAKLNEFMNANDAVQFQIYPCTNETAGNFVVLA